MSYAGRFVPNQKTRRLLNKLCIMPVSVALISFGASAQTVSPTDTQAAKSASLQEVVVSATRGEKAVDDAPGSVVVITREELSRRPQLYSPDQAFNLTPGVYIQRPRGTVIDTTFNEIVVRGIPEQKRTLYMVDGVPLNNAFLGRYFGGAIEDFDQSELVKGGYSSLYGGNAIGGVINNIVHTPRQREANASFGFGSGLNSSSGIDGRRRSYVSVGDRFNDRLSVFVSYMRDSADNYPSSLVVRAGPAGAGITGAVPTTNALGVPQFLVGDRGDTATRNENVTFKAVLDVLPGQSVGLLYMRSDVNILPRQPNTLLLNAAGAPTFAFNGATNSGSFLQAPERLLQDVWSLTYEGQVGPGKAKVTASLFDRPDRNGFSFPLGAGNTFAGGGAAGLFNTPSRTNRLDGQYSLAIGASQLLTVGATATSSRATQTNTTARDWRDLESSNGVATAQYRGKEHSYALFVQDEIAVSDKLTAYAGLRYDSWRTLDGYAQSNAGPAIPATNYPERSQNATSPRLSLVYKALPAVTLRASAGAAFRAPNVFELYTVNLLVATVLQGSADLKPERARTWDIGADWQATESLLLKASYFGAEVRDYIYRRVAGTNGLGLTSTVFSNAAKAQIDGVELSGEAKLGHGFGVFANYTYTGATFKENAIEPTSVGNQIPLVPRNMTNLGINFAQGPWYAGSNLRYVSKRYSNADNSDGATGVPGGRDSYTVADFSVRYRVHKAFDVSLSVDNLFDHRYFDSVLAPGRTVFLKLSGRL